MSTKHLAKWFNLASCPISPSSDKIVPSGINKDNFIVIETDGTYLDDNFDTCCIHKYSIETNKWTTTDLFETVNETIGDIICYSEYAAFDTNQNVLYFVHHDSN
eukprot:56203_1